MSGAFERRPIPRSSLAAWTRCVGIETWVCPLPGFATTHAILAARYGSAASELSDGTPIPAGCAHFLEHEMFQKAAGDLFDVYDARGAAANAYTTFGHTAYVFACTRDFPANLNTLLESVRDLEVDDTAVDRERAIIGQEIAMYDDDPTWRGYFNLLQALYRDHPVRRDIAGTARSIQRIDKHVLQRVHRSGYRTANLLLVVAGPVEVDEVARRVEQAFGTARVRPRAPWAGVPEAGDVRRPRATVRLPVSRPHAWLGLKDAPVRGRAARVRRQVLSSLALDVLFGDGGRIEAEAYGKGWVDDSLAASYEMEAGAAHAIVSAEVDDARAWARRLLRALEQAAAEGIGAEELRRARRRALGRYLRTLNAPEAVAHWLLGAALDRTPLEAPLRVLEDATPALVTRRLRDLVLRPRAWSVVLPRAS